jgi:hypothetical protein
MVAFSRCRLLTILAGAAMLLVPHLVRAQVKDPRDGAGIVWFTGSVLEKSEGQMAIDLGDAHALEDGEDVAVFRLRDNQFRPLGTIQIQQSRATWSMPKTTIRFDLEPGDRIVYARTLAQLGTADLFRDRFIRQQIIKTGLQNRYSTINQLEEAAVLERYRARQPRWERDQEHVAGVVRSATVSRTDLNAMQPLLTQVLTFQHYQKLGVPIEPTVGPEWQSVLTTLTPTPQEVFDSVKRAANAAEVAKQQDNSGAKKDNNETLKKVASIRRHVDSLMFLRSPEERNVVTILCAALDVAQPRNERQWYSLQLRKTQFESLSDEKLLLDEIELVMRRVREQK